MPRAVAARSSTRGFTLVEVLVALVLFAISVVGLLALESRSIEAQRSASDIREAERLAQREMSDLLSRSFLGFLEEDFEGNAPPLAFPYDDTNLAAADRVADYHRPPADIPDTDTVVGAVLGKYLIVREVDLVFDPNDPPSNPPLLQSEEPLVLGLSLHVLVLWIDGTNSAFPAPADLLVTDLTPDHVDPTSAEFRPYVRSVEVRTVRSNDAVSTL